VKEEKKEVAKQKDQIYEKEEEKKEVKEESIKPLKIEIPP